MRMHTLITDLSECGAAFEPQFIVLLCSRYIGCVASAVVLDLKTKKIMNRLQGVAIYRANPHSAPRGQLFKTVRNRSSSFFHDGHTGRDLAMDEHRNGELPVGEHRDNVCQVGPDCLNIFGILGVIDGNFNSSTV